MVTNMVPKLPYFEIGEIFVPCVVQTSNLQCFLVSTSQDWHCQGALQGKGSDVSCFVLFYLACCDGNN